MTFKIGYNIYNGINIPLSRSFTEKYMIKAPHTFSVIYLYTLSLCLSGNPPKDNNEISTALAILESDVVRCWEYWQKNGLVAISENGVEFTDLNKDNIIIEETQNKPTEIQKPLADLPMEYSPDELSVYAEKYPQVRKVFELAQHHLGRLLTHRDLSIIFSLYDYYKLPFDVLDILFTTYAHKTSSMKYFESVAQDWSTKGITTAQKATEYVAEQKKFSSHAHKIMKAFGQGNREPLKFELDFINKWAGYNFEFDIIKEACTRTVAVTGKCNFSYCDKMLSAWYKNGVKTLEDINAADEKFYAQKSAEKTDKPNKPKTTSSQPKKNRFVNYEQRSDWDFEELERMEREHNKRKLEG